MEHNIKRKQVYILGLGDVDPLIPGSRSCVLPAKPSISALRNSSLMTFPHCGHMNSAMPICLSLTNSLRLTSSRSSLNLRGSV